MAQIDRSDEADARRFRWLLDGNGYFMEERMLCGPWTFDVEAMGDRARAKIDKEMEREDEEDEDA